MSHAHDLIQMRVCTLSRAEFDCGFNERTREEVELLRSQIGVVIGESEEGERDVKQQAGWKDEIPVLDMSMLWMRLIQPCAPVQLSSEPLSHIETKYCDGCTVSQSQMHGQACMAEDLR